MSNDRKNQGVRASRTILGIFCSLGIMLALSGCGGSSDYSIEGNITVGGAALPAATVTLSGSGSQTVTTDANGRYFFDGLTGGIYSVTPSFPGYTFIPPYRKAYLDGMVATDFDFAAIVTGRLATTNHTIFQKSDGTVWTWGHNASGQLGDGTTTDSSLPVQVNSLTNVTAVAAGNDHTAALKSDGTVWTWGANNRGQLGNGTTTDSSLPVQVSNLANVTAVAAGNNHTAVLNSDGTVFTWGANDQGQLGNNITTDSTVPVQTAGLHSIIAIAASRDHTVALRNDLTVLKVWCWGNNASGQLGNGTITNSPTPVEPIGLPSVTAVAAGYDHTVVLANDGTVWTWGGNASGQLGNGTITDSFLPMQVTSLANVTALAAGNQDSMVLKSDGTLWVWGSNGFGQLGDGTTINTSTPLQVVP